MSRHRGSEAARIAKRALSAFLGVRRFGIRLLVVASGFLLAAPVNAQLATSPWPMFQNNPSHTGVSPFDTSANTGTVEWQFATGAIACGGIVTPCSPAIGSDGTIYIGSEDHNLYALNSDGSLKWAFATGGFVISSPAIGVDGTIYVGSGDHNFYAINPDGTQKWSFPTGGFVNASPAIGSDGTIYVANDLSNGNAPAPSHLLAIHPDGTQKWAFTTGSVLNSSPAIGSDGTIYIGSADFNLYAVNPDGTQRWKFLTGGSFQSGPVIGSDGTIYAASGDFNLYAINPNGSEKWQFSGGHGESASPVIGSDGTIYWGSSNHNVYAINPDGSQKWAFADGAQGCLAIGGDGTIYVGEANLDALNPDGTEKWQFLNPGQGVGCPAIASDGTIYAGSSDFDVYAFGPATVPTPTPAGTPTATATSTPTPTPIPGGGRIMLNGTKKNSKITINASAPKTIVSGQIMITNTGTGPLNGSVTAVKHNPPFTERVAGPFSIAPGGQRTIVIIYSPTKKGSTSDSVEISSDDPTIKKMKPIEVTISGKTK